MGSGVPAPTVLTIGHSCQLSPSSGVEARGLPRFSLPESLTDRPQLACETDSNLPLAFAGSLCYLGRLRGLGAADSALLVGEWLGLKVWPAVVAELVDALP
jgi:hypothetical protein